MQNNLLEISTKEHSKIIKRLATVNQMVQHYPCLTTGGLRWLIFNQDSNGFKKCVRRIGRRILIDLSEFEEWLDQQGVK